MLERKNATEQASIVLKEARKREFISRDRYLLDISANNWFSDAFVQRHVKPDDFLLNMRELSRYQTWDVSWQICKHIIGYHISIRILNINVTYVTWSRYSPRGESIMRANEASVSPNCFGCLQKNSLDMQHHVISCADTIIRLYFRQKFISFSTIQFNLNITYTR